MSDFKSGEVLVAAARHLPKCEHNDPQPYAAIVYRGDEANVSIEVRCGECSTSYEKELPYGVEGIPSGNPHGASSPTG